MKMDGLVTAMIGSDAEIGIGSAGIGSSIGKRKWYWKEALQMESR